LWPNQPSPISAQADISSAQAITCSAGIARRKFMEDTAKSLVANSANCRTARRRAAPYHAAASVWEGGGG
jgi:hypothetical protein